MNIEISRDALLKPVQQVIGVVERRQTLAILANLLLQVRDGQLMVTANDLEVELVASTPVINGEDSEATVPGRKLLDICRALPDGSSLRLRVEGQRMVIRSGRSRFSLATLPVEDYPTSDEIVSTREFSLSQGLLRRLIERTHFCMAHQDVRYFLNGLLLELRDGSVRAVATDGHRLALCEAATDVPSDTVSQVIIPRKGVSELLRLLGDSDASVECRLGANAIQLQFASARFTSKLVDGRFPDYEKVIPEPGKNRMVVDRETLRNALSRVAILSNEKYKGVRFGADSAALRIVAHNPEQEEAEEELAVDYEGETLEIGFNVSYLIDALAALEGDVARLWFRDGDSSCLIQENEDGDCRYLVMPMRL